MAAGWPSDVLGSASEIGPDDARVLAIAGLIRAEFAEETGARFPTLSRIPSTRVTGSSIISRRSHRPTALRYWMRWRGLARCTSLRRR